MQGSTEQKNVVVRADSAMTLGRCLVEGYTDAKSSAFRTRGKTFGASLIIETLLLGVLLATPLLSSARFQVPKIHPPQLAYFGVWHGRTSQQQPGPVTARNSQAMPNPFSKAIALHTPVNVPSGEESQNESIPDMPGESGPGMVQVIDLGERASQPEPLRSSQPAQPEKHPLKISQGVLEAQLISRVEPPYPTLAVQARVEGAVVLHATISRDGRITSLEVVSGHPFLVKAALDAVRQWRYRPTMLNGEPVEVETSITVIFRLHS
jgi:TonB family protein